MTSRSNQFPVSSTWFHGLPIWTTDRPAGLIDRICLRTRASGIGFLPHAERALHRVAGKYLIIYAFIRSIPFTIELLNRALRRSHLPPCRFQVAAGKTVPEPIRSLADPPPDCSGYILLGDTFSGEIAPIEILLDWVPAQTRPVVVIPILNLAARDPFRVRFNTCWNTFRFGGRGLFSCGNPVDLNHLESTVRKPWNPAHIRRQLLRSILREHRVITGNIPEPRRQLIRRLVQSDDLQNLIRTTSLTMKTPPGKTKRSVESLIREIATDYRDFFPRLWRIVLDRYLFRLYDSIEFDESGLERLRSTIRQNKKCILIPTHRSHMDYITLSFGCYQEGIAPPLIAAGKNLAFWPMGFIFRHTGAFFIRRSFKGMEMYARVFRRYVLDLLQKPQPIEVFLEGGRSRSGRLRHPKLGFLRILLDAVQERHISNLTLVPISINYDRILEEDSYLKELSGQPKSTERLTDMVRNLHLLNRKQGGIYITVGDPLVLGSGTGGTECGVEDREEIAHELMYRLGANLAVSPMALMSTSILRLPGTSIDAASIPETMSELLKYLKTQSCAFTGDLSDNPELDRIFRRTLDFLIRIQYFEPESQLDSESRRFRLRPEVRKKLDYSRNSLAIHMIPVAVAGLAEIESISGTELPEFIVGLLCPHMHPVNPDRLVPALRSAREYLKAKPRDTATLFASFILPEIKIIKRVYRYFKHSVGPGLKLDSIRLKTHIEKALTLPDIEKDYPERFNIETIEFIRRCFQAHHILFRESSGRFSFLPAQPDIWERFEVLVPDEPADPSEPPPT
ncbi:1-acyl-sn-glycerol-3-phosphate acyltransferase [bacterium]|nr:1-acyl-sn-glycerol-3-phosphate acyltransferase [candidate division CSSED10-310 bacterium]